jgi:hypothetical protein
MDSIKRRRIHEMREEKASSQNIGKEVLESVLIFTLIPFAAEGILEVDRSEIPALRKTKPEAGFQIDSRTVAMFLPNM